MKDNRQFNFGVVMAEHLTLFSACLSVIVFMF